MNGWSVFLSLTPVSYTHLDVYKRQALCSYLTELLREGAVLYRQEKDVEDIFNQLYRESLFKSYTLVNLSLIHIWWWNSSPVLS